MIGTRAKRSAGDAASVLLTAAVVYGVVSQGGFHPQQRWVLAGLVVGAGMWGGAGDRFVRPPGTPALALGGFAVSLFLSAILTGRLRDAVPGLVLIVVVAGAVAVGRRDTGGLLPQGLVAAGVVAALAGWYGVAFHATPLGQPGQGLWRAASTITYPNATAALLVPLLLWAVAAAAREPGPAWRLAGYVLAVGFGATLSRSGLLALLAGVILLVIFLGLRDFVRASWPVALGAAVALAGLGPSMPTASPVRPWLPIAGLVAGAVVTVVMPRLPRRAVLVLGAALLVAGVIVAAPAGVRLFEGRIDPASETRLADWRGAWEVGLERPLLGSGPGALAGRVTNVGFAHNEYLQVFAEQGVVGVAALLGLVTACGLALRRSFGRLDRHVWAGSAAAFAAVWVHAGFDFSFHVPLIPVVAGAVFGLGTPHEASYT